MIKLCPFLASHVINLASTHGRNKRSDKCIRLSPSLVPTDNSSLPVCSIDQEIFMVKIFKVYLHYYIIPTIFQAPQPRNLQELWSFLGLLNYYGKFIPNLATLVRSLNSILQHGQQWKQTNECIQAFQEAKEALSSLQVLVHYDHSLPITLAGDTPAYGISAVYSHILPDGTESPTLCQSTSMAEAQDTDIFMSNSTRLRTNINAEPSISDKHSHSCY